MTSLLASTVALAAILHLLVLYIKGPKNHAYPILGLIYVAIACLLFADGARWQIQALTAFPIFSAMIKYMTKDKSSVTMPIMFLLMGLDFLILFRSIMYLQGN